MAWTGLDPPLNWTNTVAASNGNITRVTGLCCGLTGPETNMNGSLGFNDNFATSSLLYSGYAQGGNPTSAFTKAWSLQGNAITLNGNSWLGYVVFPQANGGQNGNSSVNGNNSMYVALNVVFTDGTDTRSAGLVDANNVAFTAQGQGAGGKLILNSWNYVRVNLSSLAGKTVSRIDVGWEYDGATGGYRGYIDQVWLLGQTPGYAAIGTLDANWTPKWTNVVGYWPLNGSGLLANNQNILGVVGGNLQAANINGSGMAYVNGVAGQGIFLDGIDDRLSVYPNYTSNSNAFTIALWYKYWGYWDADSYAVNFWRFPDAQSMAGGHFYTRGNTLWTLSIESLCRLVTSGHGFQRQFIRYVSRYGARHDSDKPQCLYDFSRRGRAWRHQRLCLGTFYLRRHCCLEHGPEC